MHYFVTEVVEQQIVAILIVNRGAVHRGREAVFAHLHLRCDDIRPQFAPIEWTRHYQTQTELVEELQKYEAIVKNARARGVNL
jgi:hypothetical protein